MVWIFIVLLVVSEIYSADVIRRESTYRGNNVAFLELVLYRNDNKGDYTTSTYRMEGKFANIGALYC